MASHEQLAAWDSEHELTKDPKSELSLIYYDSRAGLEERVLRIRSGLSAARRRIIAAASRSIASSYAASVLTLRHDRSSASVIARAYSNVSPSTS